LLLASLSAGDAAALGPSLKPVHLERQLVLYEDGQKIDAVYFPTTAIVSLVVALSSGETVEAAMIGRDGVLGVAAALDGKTSLSRAIVQIAGGAMACEVSALKRVAMKSRSLTSLLIRHEQTVYVQAQQSTACMAAHEVEARLSRWLLRARDLSDSDTLPFTQEFLAEMLGVSRGYVTGVAGALQDTGIIKYERGKIKILDLAALRETACECYETVNSHYQALLGRLPEVST
jgi:CRP-like cAMP-binding protein